MSDNIYQIIYLERFGRKSIKIYFDIKDECEYLFKTFNVNSIDKILKASREVDGDKKVSYYYDITSKISLYEYVKYNGNFVNEDFYNIVLQIIDTLLEMKNYLLDYIDVFISAKYIYLNTETKKVYLLCVPVYNTDKSTGKLIDFINYGFDNYISTNELDMQKIEKLLENIKDNILDLNEIKKIFRTFVNDNENQVKNQYSIKLYLAKVKEKIKVYNNRRPVNSDGIKVNEDTCLITIPERNFASLYKNIDNTWYENIISKDNYVIGRMKTEVDLTCDSNTVSKIHAKILYNNCKYTLIDYNSKNGTYINDERVLSNREYELKDNDKLHFGEDEYIFRL